MARSRYWMGVGDMYLQKGEDELDDSQVVISLLLVLAGDIEMNPGPEILTMKDHFRVAKFLENLDKKDLKKLGGALGLSYPKLKNMDPLCEEMVAAWLNKEDDVIELSGEPSWESLKAALREIGQTGLADIITQEKVAGVETGTQTSPPSESVQKKFVTSLPSQEETEVQTPPSSENVQGMSASLPLHEVTSKSTHNSNAAISCKDIKSERCDLPQNSTVSLNDKGGNEMEDKFPFLKVERLNEEEKKRLMGRLEMESEEIRYEFVSVANQTVQSLSSTCNDISRLKMSLKFLKIPGINECDDKVDNILPKTFEHCSFFSFGILKSVISDFGTSHDKERLTKYESKFKVYCKRRLCEVPIDTEDPSMQNKTKICIMTDNIFDVPAEEVYKLEPKLEKILGVPVYLRGVKPGSITFIFCTFHDVDTIFPLNEKQIDQLKRIGALKVFYSRSKDMRKSPSHAHLQYLPAQSLLSTASSLGSLPPLSSAPSYYASTIDAYSSLFVRVYHPIALSLMESLLKDLLLGLTILNYHDEKNGLYEFKYPCECGPKVFPLSYKKERKLLEIGVQSLNCEIYEFHLAFEDPQSATDHDLPIDLSLDSLSTPQSPLAPAPPYFGAVIGDYSSLFVRVDHPITSMETFEHDVSCIVDLRLNFYAEEDGYYEFKFKYLHKCEVFPLSHEQERKLLNIGVQLLKCGTYRFQSKSRNLSAIYPQSIEDTSSPEPEFHTSDDINIMTGAWPISPVELTSPVNPAIVSIPQIQHERSLGSCTESSTHEDSLPLPGDTHHNKAQAAQLMNAGARPIPPVEHTSSENHILSSYESTQSQQECSSGSCTESSTHEDSLSLPCHMYCIGAQLLNDTEERIPPSAYEQPLQPISAQPSQPPPYSETISDDDPISPPPYGRNEDQNPPPHYLSSLDSSSEDLDRDSPTVHSPYSETISDDDPNSPPPYGRNENQNPPPPYLPSLDSSSEDLDRDSPTVHLLEPDNSDTNSNSKKCCKDHSSTILTLASCTILIVLFITIFLSLFLTLPTSQSGEILIGNNDVVLAATLDPNNVNKVDFSNNVIDPLNITIEFYHDSCSEFPTENYQPNNNGQLSTIDNMQYIIDQTYVLRGSVVQFTFSSSNSSLQVNSSTCIASIAIFFTYSDFTAFLASGLVANANASYCLPSASSITFNVSADDQNFHYFVGLKGLESATVNYTLIKEIVRYNVAKLTATICTFPTQSCSIILDHHDGACILAHLQSKNLISLNFIAERSSKLTAQTVFSWIALGCSIVAFLICCIRSFFLIKSKENRRICIRASCCTLISFGIAIGVGLSIGLTIPALPSGEVLIGNNDVVFVTPINSYVSRTNFNNNANNLLDITFYHDKCSEIPFNDVYNNCSQQLNTIGNMQYIIDQAYMIEGSEMQYVFSRFSSNVSSLSSDSCAALIPVFLTYSDFTAFLASGLIANANASYCLPPASSITFTISAKDNLHYFVGLQSFQSSVIDYTMQGHIREYDVTDMATTVCTFPSSSCSIDNPPGGQDICILASLQLSDTFVTLIYTSEESDRHSTQFTFAIIISVAPIIMIIIIIIILIISCVFN